MSNANTSGEMPPNIPDSNTRTYLSPGKILIEHAERAILIFGYFLLLILSINNIYKYVYRRKMYKSYPMLVSYILLFIFCCVTISYEFYMTLKCYEHDCMAVIIRDSTYNTSNVVYLLWKLRQ